MIWHFCIYTAKEEGKRIESEQRRESRGCRDKDVDVRRR